MERICCTPHGRLSAQGSPATGPARRGSPEQPAPRAEAQVSGALQIRQANTRLLRAHPKPAPLVMSLGFLGFRALGVWQTHLYASSATTSATSATRCAGWRAPWDPN